jgi:prevent-host-death family protein
MAYTVHQAKTNFSRLLKEAEAGNEVIVTRGKKPVAKIVPVDPPAVKQRLAGGFEGLVRFDDSALAPMTDEDLVEYGFECMLDGTLVKPPEKAEAAEREQAG